MVKVTEQHTGINLTHIATYTSFTVLNLHPFYIYQFTVSAYTVAPGPHTDVYTVQTLEERKLTIMQRKTNATVIKYSMDLFPL